jgi:GTP-binding protein
LAEYILDQHKPAIFVVNKWDLMVPMPTGKMGDYIQATFPSLAHVPIAFITAKAGRNVQQVLNLAQALHKQASARVTTGDLNRVIREAMDRNPPPLRQNRRAKVYYATQVGTNPPTIVLFTNGPELFDNTYQRYLLKTFRDQLPFSEVAIKLYLRAKRREDTPETAEPPQEKPARKKRGSKSGGLPFRTELEESEQPGKGSPYESELWRDV